MKPFLLFLILLPFFTLSQNDKVYYTGVSVNMVYSDPKTKEVYTMIPMGKNLELIYDKFFKNWKIYFINSDGEKKLFEWKFVRYTDKGYMVANDNFGGSAEIADLISSKSMLLVYPHMDLVEGKFAYYAFEGIKLKK